MEWTEESSQKGVVTKSFLGNRGERSIPGRAWFPEGSEIGPIVLIGHGGSGSVLEDHVGALARGLVRTYGATCIAIEGPVHGLRRGERSSDPTLVMLDFSQVWASDPTMTDEMVADWRVVLSEISQECGLEDRRVGYWGLSMGTLLGLPLVVAEPRIVACVLGLAGSVGPTSERLLDDAPKVTIPTLFLMQWDDELFPRESCLELFAAIGSSDKQLHATPGLHSAVTDETFMMTAEFLGKRLATK